MMGSTKLVTAVFMAIFVVSLTACGGGGGGDSFTPLAYTGSTTAAAINDTNAADLAELAYTGSDLGNVVPLASATSGSTAPVEPPAPVLQSLVNLSRALPAYAANLPVGPSSPAAAMTIPSETMGCTSGGNMTMSGSLATDGTATISISFAACNQDDIYLNGAISVSMSSNSHYTDGFPDTESPANFITNMTFKNISMQFPLTGDNITLYGTVAMDVTQSVTNPVTDMRLNMVMRDGVTGLLSKIENYHVVATDYFTHEEITISARVFSSAHGYVDITTLTPFEDDGVSEYPTAGILHLEGAGASWAEVDFSLSAPQGSWDNGQGITGTFSL